ncbi:hypothetical protein Aple_094590 [Acrocarpospora pleiomorpha]|uniref:Uncharacterized protein n=1 Tax=Acrocarpospora pleiomorpha TaxID=90975 RepID=A0A5M3XZW9_9ACTN|nr:hypothetical protein Aple_094590 [Acrocarpospora pleiomorpha]
MGAGDLGAVADGFAGLAGDADGDRVAGGGVAVVVDDLGEPGDEGAALGDVEHVHAAGDAEEGEAGGDGGAGEG